MRVIRLTPPGVGGVALLRIEGPGVLSFLERRFVRSRRPGAHLPPASRPALGRLLDPAGEPIDEVLLVRTGPEAFEVGCHGGPAVVRQVVETLLQAGAQEVTSGDLRAESRDSIRAEAEAALERATTELGCRVLLAQVGCWTSELGLLIPLLSRDQEAAGRRLRALAATAPFGLALLAPPRVALIGPPNAGKSSLMNALLERERVIVNPAPGTTRDAIEEMAELSGVPARLVDTAGERRTSDPLEADGVARAREAAEEAECRLVILDAPVLLEDGPDARAAQRLADRAREPRLVVLNKCDLLEEDQRTRLVARLAVALDPLWVSALTGAGLSELRERLRTRLVGSPPEEGPVVFTLRQAALLEDALRALERGDPARARVHLGAVGGRG